MESTAPSARSLSHGSDTLAQEATVRSLMSRDLAGDPAKELLMIAVEYPPGSVDPVHTHHAQALVYVLEGTIVMSMTKRTAMMIADPHGRTHLDKVQLRRRARHGTRSLASRISSMRLRDGTMAVMSMTGCPPNGS